MSIRWSEPQYLADWRVATFGAARVGFISPPVAEGQPWSWTVGLSPSGWPTRGEANSEEGARAAVGMAWDSFLAAAGLAHLVVDNRPWVRFRLPLPPSVWDLYHGHGANKRKTPEYKRWLKDAGWFIKAPASPIAKPFDIVIAMERPHGAMDVDNRLKPVLDCMQHYRVIKNDNLCESAGIRWQPGLGAECVAELRECTEVPTS